MSIEELPSQEWRVTFGQRYRHELHPTFRRAHPDGWVTIVAATEDQARVATSDWLGQHWSFMYQVGSDESNSIDWAWRFPRGELYRLEADGDG